MRILTIGFAVVGLFVCAGVTMYRIADRWLSDPATLAQRQLQLDQARRDGEWFAQMRDALTPFLVVAAAVFLLALVVGAVAFVAIAVLRFADGREKTRWTFAPNRDGLLPVTSQTLDTAAAAALVGFHQARIEAAKQPALPANLRAYHHAPRYIEGRSAPQSDQLATPETSSLPAPTPTFGQLLQARVIGHDSRLLLGYADGAPLFGTWRDLYSAAVVGLQGSGKSTTLRFLAAQSALVGASFVVVDPHGDAGEDSLAATLAPLSSAMLADPASDEQSILRVLALVEDELARRRHGQRGAPLILFVDELSALQRGRLAAPLSDLLEQVAQEGRKFGVFCLLSGQIWTTERSGGSAVRDALAACYLHRSKPSQARLVWPGVGREVQQLQPGQAMLCRTTGDVVRVTVPQTTDRDLVDVSHRLPAPSTTRTDSASWSAPTKRQPAPAPAVQQVSEQEPLSPVEARAAWRVLTSQDSVEDVPARASTPTAADSETTDAPGDVPARAGTLDDDQRVVDLYRQGKSRNTIAVEVFGARTPRTQKLVNEALRRAGLVGQQEGTS